MIFDGEVIVIIGSVDARNALVFYLAHEFVTLFAHFGDLSNIGNRAY